MIIFFNNLPYGYPGFIHAKTLSLLNQWHISTTLARYVPYFGETVLWVPLPPGFFKLNFDGSVNSATNSAGVGTNKWQLSWPMLKKWRGLVFNIYPRWPPPIVLHGTCR